MHPRVSGAADNSHIPSPGGVQQLQLQQMSALRHQPPAPYQVCMHAHCVVLTGDHHTALQQPCMQALQPCPLPCQPSVPRSPPPLPSDDLGLAAQPVDQLLGAAHHDAALALGGLLDMHNLCGQARGLGSVSQHTCTRASGPVMQWARLTSRTCKQHAT